MLGELAAARGLADASGYGVEPLTPLLARAVGRELDPAARGALSGGGEAVIGRLRFSGGDAVGAESDMNFDFWVVVASVPESAPLVPRLFCRKRGRVDGLSGMGFELDEEALWTESEALQSRYEVATSPYQDENWTRQLFAPAFISWLVAEPPQSFAFELAYGDLVGSIDATHSTPADVVGLWDATGAVATRIREECLEERDRL
jgi:hypothetical protein